MTNYKNTNKAQVTKGRIRFTFAMIVLITLFTALIVTPKIPDSIPTASWFNSFKIRLGLDLQGGSHLVYQADLSAIDTSDVSSRIESLRDVIERRVNAYGVSEAVVQTNKSGDNYRIIVELAGVKDVNEAISIIDRTPFLDFKLQDTSVTPDDTATGETNLEKEKAQGILDRVLKGEDFGTLAKEFSEDTSTAENGGQLDWVVEDELLPEFNELKIGQVSEKLVESQNGYHIIKIGRASCRERV